MVEVNHGRRQVDRVSACGRGGWIAFDARRVWVEEFLKARAPEVDSDAALRGRPALGRRHAGRVVSGFSHRSGALGTDRGRGRLAEQLAILAGEPAEVAETEIGRHIRHSDVSGFEAEPSSGRGQCPLPKELSWWLVELAGERLAEPSF